MCTPNCIFLFTFMVFLNSVAPTGIRLWDENERIYTLDLNNRVVVRPRGLRFDDIINSTLHDEDMNMFKVNDKGIAVFQEPPPGTPSPDIIKALLDSIPGGSEYCIQMANASNSHFMVGKLQTTESVPNWIMKKPRAPYSEETVYLWNPEHPCGPHSGAVGYHIVGDVRRRLISEKDVRAYVKINDEHFFTAKLQLQADAVKAPPIWPIEKNIQQIYVRHPSHHRIYGGPLVYLLRDKVPPVVIEQMRKITCRFL